MECKSFFFLDAYSSTEVLPVGGIGKPSSFMMSSLFVLYIHCPEVLVLNGAEIMVIGSFERCNLIWVSIRLEWYHKTLWQKTNFPKGGNIHCHLDLIK